MFSVYCESFVITSIMLSRIRKMIPPGADGLLSLMAGCRVCQGGFPTPLLWSLTTSIAFSALTLYYIPTHILPFPLHWCCTWFPFTPLPTTTRHTWLKSRKGMVRASILLKKKKNGYRWYKVRGDANFFDLRRFYVCVWFYMVLWF